MHGTQETGSEVVRPEQLPERKEPAGQLLVHCVHVVVSDKPVPLQVVAL